MKTSEPYYITHDAPEPERDYCEECGEGTNGTSLCDGCRGAHFGDIALIDLPVIACPACYSMSVPFERLGVYQWRRCVNPDCCALWVAP